MAFQVSGFVSGLDVPTIVSQLIASESQPQSQLKTQLSSVRADAAAYRDVNSKFSAVLSAAQNLSAASFGTGLTATSTDTSVVAGVGTGATPGTSITFSVTQLAAARSEISSGTWSSATAPITDAGPSWPLTVLDASGNPVGTPITLPAGATLADAARAITNSPYGLTAGVVQTGANQFKLQVASKSTGTANSFQLQGTGEATPDGSFTALSTAKDATLDLGGGVTATSATNIFSNLLNGVSVTVSQPTGSGVPTTVSVSTDTSKVVKQMQALVDAANAALQDVSNTTSTATGKVGVLAGDYGLQSLAQQLLMAVSDAVVTGTDANGAPTSASPAQVGLQLDRDGNIVFDAAKFSTALATTPDLVKQLVAGTTATPGIATRLATLAKSATDSVTGTLVTLANGQDSRAKDLQSQIDDWTLRLAQRQQDLTTQYSNLQSMLSTLQSQQSWLSSMLSSTTSKSSSSSG